MPSSSRRDDGPSFTLEFRVFSDGLEADDHHDDGDDKGEEPKPACTPSCPTQPAPPRQPPSCFRLFPALPTELRLKVWEHAIRPRIVMVSCADDGGRAAWRDHVLSRCRGRHRPRNPVVLAVCRESRAVGLRHYELAFAWKTPLSMVPLGGNIGRWARSDDPQPAAASRAFPSSPARVYFNFALDALYLMGELEPLDPFGLGTPMAYFLPREDAARVRHVAVAFDELSMSIPGYGGGGGGPGLDSHRVFACLFHVVDRFPLVERLLVACCEADVDAVPPPPPPPLLERDDNPIQRLWRGWIEGTSVVSSTLAQKQILMVREEGLGEFIGMHL